MMGKPHRVWLAAASLTLYVGACVTLRGVFPREADRGLAFPHAIHTEQGLDCTDCHFLESEEGETLPMPLVPQHENCNLCHDIIGDAEDTSSCNLCHTRPDQLVDDRVNLLQAEQIFNHQPHVDAEVACTVCHENPDGRRLPNVPIMEWCMDCHAEQSPEQTETVADLNDCATCHTIYREELRPTHRGETRIAHDVPALWEHVHGRESAMDEAFCAKCHTEQEDCEACHRIQEPDDHTLAWRRKTHGLHATWERQKCAVCHEEESCMQCHENTRPTSHRARWGRPANSHCANCHFPAEQNNCTVCHQRIDHPTALPSPHTIGIYPQNCALCHPGGIPTRAPHVQNSSVTCAVCHL